MKKGFTLVELLISIVIIALLTLIVIPGIRKLYADNQKSLYKSYEKVVLEYGNAENTLGLVDICNIENLKYVKNECNGYILEENGKRKAYISCGDYYETENYVKTYACSVCGGCETSESLGKIDVSAKAAGLNYVVNRPYGEVRYVNTKDVQVTFRASEDVDRFAYFNATNNVQLGVCTNVVDSGSIKTCTTTIDKSGMYYVKGYVQGKVTSYKAYFNIKIDVEAPTFNFENTTTHFDMTGDEWDNYDDYPYTNKIIDLKDNIAVKSLTYRIDSGTEKNILTGEHKISEQLFGNHVLKVTATDDAGNTTSKSLSLTFERTLKDDVITVTPFNSVYDGNVHQANAVAKSGLTVDIVYYSNATCTESVSEVKNVGKYYAILSTQGNYAYNVYSKCHEVGEITRKNATLTLSETSGTLTYGTNKNVNITKDGDGTLSCSSSDTNVVTCNLTGSTLVIIPKPNTTDGKTAVITVTSSQGTNYNAASAQYNAIVNRQLLTCPVSPSDKVYTGSTQQSGIICPVGSTNGGTTSATNAGTYNHTCNNASGYKFSSACSVSWKITAASSNLSISPASSTLTFGTNATATISSNSNGAYSCSSSDTSVATCSISGTTLTITPKANTSDGKTATIKVKQDSTTNYVEKTVNYSATVNRKVLTCPSSPADKEYTGEAQASGVTCPTNSTSGGDTSKTEPGTYAHTCTPNSGYKFSSTCSVSWKIKDKITYDVVFNCNGGTCLSSKTGVYTQNVPIAIPSKTFKITIGENTPNATISKMSVDVTQPFNGWTSSHTAGLADTALKGYTTQTSWDGSLTTETTFKNLRKTSGVVYLTANWRTASVSLPTITKTGYTCGFATTSGGNIAYASGASYATSTTANGVTLYPVCVGNKYTASFIYNSNTTSGSITVATKTVSCTVSNDAGNCTVAVPTEVSSSVGKYNAKYHGVTTSLSSMATTGTITLTGDATYYANYSSAVSVTYLKTATSTSTKTTSLYRNEYFTSASAMKTILADAASSTTTKTDYTISDAYGSFKGLALSNDTTTNYNPSSTSLINTNSVGFYGVTEYSVSYSKGSNISSIGNTSATCLVTVNSKKCAVTLPTITANTGYTSVGWSTTNGATTGTNAGSSYNITADDITLYANASMNAYTIQYVCNGGTCNGATNANYDSNINLAVPTKNFKVNIDENGTGATLSALSATKAQTFNGWTATNLGSNAKSGTSSNPTTAWTGSLTNNTYFRYLRDTSGTITMTANWQPTAITLPRISKTGNTCGYSSSANGTIQYASGATYTPSATANTTTLYAICNGNTYTATFIYNSNTASGSLTASTATATCTVPNGEIKCNIIVPSAVTSSVGKYNSAYHGVTDSLSSMSTITSISLSQNKTYYANYSSNINIKYLTNATTIITANPELCRNEFFTSSTAMDAVTSAVDYSIIQKFSLSLSGVYGTFVGYATNDSSTTAYAINNSNLINNSTKTYYVVSRYDVNYLKGSNVSSIGSSTGNCNATVAAKGCNVTLPTITASTGYKAVGWNTSIDATTGTSAGSQYKLTKNNMTLYGNAGPNSYSISYTCGGGTCNGPTSGNYDSDVQIANPSKTFVVTIDSNSTGATIGATSASSTQTFSGWTSTTTNGLNSAAKSGTSANPSTAWSGSSTKNTYFRNIGNPGNTVTLTANWTAVGVSLPTITKNGYSCGYSTSASGTIQYASGGTYTPSTTGNGITLYAICKGKTYTATFNKNGATEIGSTSLTCTVSNTDGTCTVTAPSITRANFAITGWGTSASATTGIQAGKTLTLSGDTAYYAVTYKKVTISFRLNGNTSQTDSSGTASTATIVDRGCTIRNSATGCAITSPTIVAPTGFTVKGYTTGADVHSSYWNHNSEKTGLSDDAFWYAQSEKAAITRKLTLYKNGNTNFKYGGTTYTDNSKAFDICTIAAVYNGATQSSSCTATITMATITAPTTTPYVKGWGTSASATTVSYTSGQTSVQLTMDGNKSLYAISAKGLSPCDYIINKKGVTPTGLVEDPTDSNYYIFRGSNPTNYISFNGKNYRIININKNTCQMKIVWNDSNLVCKTFSVFNDSNTNNNENYAYYILNSGSYYTGLSTTAKGYLDNTSKLYSLGRVSYYQHKGYKLADAYTQEITKKANFNTALPQVTEYMKASSNSTCYTGEWSEFNDGKYLCKNSNWMHSSFKKKSSDDYPQNIILMNGGKGVNGISEARIRWVRMDKYAGMISYTTSNYSGVCKPTHYLKKDIIITDGSGTADDPFKISE